MSKAAGPESWHKGLPPARPLSRAGWGPGETLSLLTPQGWAGETAATHDTGQGSGDDLCHPHSSVPSRGQGRPQGPE